MSFAEALALPVLSASTAARISVVVLTKYGWTMSGEHNVVNVALDIQRCPLNIVHHSLLYKSTMKERQHTGIEFLLHLTGTYHNFNHPQI